MVPFYSLCLARAYADINQFEDARRSIGEATTAVEAGKERWFEAEVYRTAGEIALKAREDRAKIVAHFNQALTIARAQQAKSWELRATMSMARLWYDEGKRKEARDLVVPIHGWFTEGFETRDLKEARGLLGELSP